MVNPEQLLKELSKLWVDLGHEQQSGESDPGGGVLRACAMTLLTIVDESEDPTNVGETVALLMREHPSRSVVIRLRESAEALLESRVFAQCWMPFGQRQQICCEQIEITASTASLQDVPAVVLPLTVPDLPVILWCRSPRVFDTSAFPTIANMSDKVILDTSAFADKERAHMLVAAASADRRVADLAWSRITGWRETICQVFTNQICLAALPKFTHAAIRYGGLSGGAEARYLAAWLQAGLKHAGSTARVGCLGMEGTTMPVMEVLLSGGSEIRVSLISDDSGGIDVTAAGLTSHSSFPEVTDYAALREELSIMSRDVVFEAALRSTQA